MSVKDFNKWDGQPRTLTNEEIADPMLVLNELFDYAHLPDLRNTLWDWLKTTVSSNFNKKSLHYKDRESLLAFYEKMQKLLEAAHLLLLAKKIALPSKTTLPTNINVPVTRQPAPATELIPIIDKLVFLLAPEFIFEMGHIQEINHSIPMYFFLLVLPNTETRTYAACQQEVELAFPEDQKVQLITLKMNEWQKYLKAGHPLYTPLCREDWLVYAKDVQALPIPDNNNLPQRIREASTIFNEAIEKAHAFYAGALFYLQQENYSLAVFMLQQAIEHSLRGFLHAVTGRNSVGHDLVTLRRSALPFFPQLVDLLPIEKDINLCLLNKAGKAYVQARYESSFCMPITEVSQLKEWAEKLLPQTKQTFDQRIENMLNCNHFRGYYCRFIDA